MKKIILAVFVLLVYSGMINSNQNPNSVSSKEKDADNFVKELLSKMTLEEKIGQMNQVTLEVVSKQRKSEADRLELDQKKLREAILDYHVGSILNTGNAANSVESWHEIIKTIQDISTKETRLKIPNLYGIDAIHGVNYTLGATIFPQSISLAASRNKYMVEETASITAYEMRACGIPWNFNPVLDMGREPLWPRLWETFGEDVYLASEMGRKYIKGQQGNDISAEDKVAVCLKHYIGYSAPKNGRDRTPAWISERMLREIYLPTFEAGVKAGAQTVMVNSGEINGIPTHSDEFLLNGILKDELQFKGLVVSDWEDIKRLHDRDRIAATPKEAVKIAVLAGLDMSMVPMDYSFYNFLLELVNEGEVPVSRIDDAVSRILRVKYLLGLFDNPYPNYDMAKNIANDKFTEVNIKAAQEVITLLKNDNGLLPLSKNQKVLVTGPASNKLSVLNSGWTITWQGNNESLYPHEKFTILESVENKVGKENTVYVEGCGFDEDINSESAVDAAMNVDVIIMCLGEPPYCESPGNINNLSMTETQIKFAQKLYQTGKPVVMVLVEGRPRVINKIEEGAAAIVMAYLPGMEGGLAVADVIFGDVNPSGKLPFTYPSDVNGYTTYDHKPIEKFDVNDYKPQWPFGHGLSYTTFEYSNLKLDKDNYSFDDKINVAVSVKNTGRLEGKETVELYVCDLYGSVTRPVKQLKRFEKINLKPGESKTLNFQLDKEDLSFIGRDNKRITEPGEFFVMINKLEKKFLLK